MPGKRGASLLAATLVAVVMATAACRPGGKADATLHMNLGSEPPTADPATAEGPAVQVDELLFLGLTDYDEKTMEVIPDLASRWEVSSDGLTWRFSLRRDVYWVRYDPARDRFQKRRPVTARDVEYGVKRALDPKTASPYAYLLYALRNGEGFSKGTAEESEVGVRAVDDYTVEFSLTQPASYFPGLLSMSVARPVPREVVEQYGEQWAEPGNIWTNGPYALTSWEHDSRMTMAKNPYYYDAKTVSIEKIDWAMVSDPSAALAMYRNGELDVCSVAGADLEQARADPKLSKELRLAPFPITYYYALNETKAPFDNKLVRQAFSFAVDRHGLVDRALKGGQLPARTLGPPGTFGSPAQDPSYKGVEYNPELARKLLAEAGYPDGKGFPEVTLAFYADPHHQLVAEYVQSGWKNVLGVDVKLAGMQWKDYYNALGNDVPQIFRGGWTPNYTDEDDWLVSVFRTQRGEDRIGWSNTEFNGLVEQARIVSEPAERKQLYAQAERILCVDEAAVIPLYYYTQPVCSKPYLERTYSPLPGQQIEHWRLKGR